MKCRLLSPGAPHLAKFEVNGVDVLKGGCVSDITVQLSGEGSEAEISFKCDFPEIAAEGTTEPPEQFLKLAEVFGYTKGEGDAD